MKKVFSLLMLLVLAACQSSLEDEIARQGLQGGIIVYGHKGDEPRSLSLGGGEGDSYPYWSLSKPITAAMVLELEKREPGLLAEDVGGASVRQLLRHTGGWDRAVSGDPISLDGDNCSQPRQTERDFVPGERQVYSNLGYCILGAWLAQRAGRSVEELAHELVPETRAMEYDPVLGPAGGWSGTALAYWRFAARPLPQESLERPEAVPVGPYYGLSWRVTPGGLSHFGLMHGRGFTLVAKRGDFAAVALFRNEPRDPDAARDRLAPLLLRLKEGDEGL